MNTFCTYLRTGEALLQKKETKKKEDKKASRVSSPPARSHLVHDLLVKSEYART